MRPDPAALVGQTVAGKYRLVRVLGTGGMGAVYEAHHAVTQRPVAVKILHSWIVAAHPTTALRFIQEAQAPTRLEHPSIVEVLDAGEDPLGLYLVFELLSGEDLESALRQKISEERIVEIVVELLEALAHAHERSLVHRDIKPANVFLAKESGSTRVKLLDFGIAKRIDVPEESQVTQQGSVIGTVDYMSPEQSMGEVVDRRSDLWSVGALLYRALSGTPPVQASNVMKLALRLATVEPTSLGKLRPDLSVRFVRAVDRAIARLPDDRFSTAREMRAALVACLEEGLFAKNRRIPRIAIGAALLLVLAAASVIAAQRGDTDGRSVGIAPVAEVEAPPPAIGSPPVEPPSAVEPPIASVPEPPAKARRPNVTKRKQDVRSKAPPKEAGADWQRPRSEYE
jgi:serine/threonine-protein kinase